MKPSNRCPVEEASKGLIDKSVKGVEIKTLPPVSKLSLA
jgi:hypothetical protein